MPKKITEKVEVEADFSEKKWKFAKALPKSLDKITAIFKKFNVYVIAITAFAFTLGKAVFAWRDQEKATNRLTQSLVQNGIFTRQLRESYTKYAEALQSNTQFNDEQIITATALLQTYVGQTEITEDLLGAVADLSAQTDQDLKASVEQIGETLAGTGTALAKFGIQIDKSSTMADRMNKIVQDFGVNGITGQAKAQAQSGAVESLMASFGGVLELVGKTMAPAVNLFANQLNAFFTGLQEQTEIFNTAGAVINFASKVTVVVKAAGVAILEIAVSASKTNMRIMSDLVGRNLDGAVKRIKANLDEAAQIMVTQHEAAIESLSAIDRERDQKESALAQAKQDTLNEELSMRLSRQLEIRESQEALFKARTETEILDLLVHEALIQDLELIAIQKSIDGEKDRTARRELDLKKRRAVDQKSKTLRTQFTTQRLRVAEESRSSKAENVDFILALMQDVDSALRGIVILAKLSTLFGIVTDTIMAIRNTWAWLVGIPIIGPILAAIASAVIALFAAERSATVLGVEMAEGGFVHGKGPQISPLPPGGITQLVNVTINGGLSGTEEEAIMVAQLINRSQ